MVPVHPKSARADDGPPSAETVTLDVLGVAAARDAADEDDLSASTKKYHVLMELGRGGTGIVSAAIARGIGGFSKLVVLKTTKPELDSPDIVKMLLNEARLSARMNHPNIVQVYEVYPDAGLPVIVMEYLDGQSLAKLLSRALHDGAYSCEIGLTIVCKVLEALEYAHTLTDFGGRALGIVHRDVTPQNVMITYDGHIKLLDFGIAKLNLQSTGTDTGSIKGKLGYMSPEQLAGLRLDARADVFAVGVMLWEVVARRRMWTQHGDADIMRRLLCEDVPSLREAVPDLDPELERICSKALAPRVEGRYESAKALLGDLQQFLAARGGAVAPATIVELMDRTCADLRATAQHRLDRELAKFSRSTDEDWSKTESEELFDGFASSERRDARQAPRDTTPATPLGRKADTGSSRGVEVPDPPRIAALRPRRSALRWLVAAALLGVSAWSLAGRQHWLEREAALVPGPAVQVVAQPPAEGSSARAQNLSGPPAPNGEVRVTVSVEPARARIFIDDQLVENPYRASRVRDGEVHALRAEAEGHLPVVRSLRFDVDVELVLELPTAPVASKTAAPGNPGRSRLKANREQATHATPAARPAPAAAVATKAANCDPPYYFDDQGIKHFQRECLNN